MKIRSKKNFHRVSFLKYKRLKKKLRVFLVRYSVGMVTYCVTKMILPCSPVIVASIVIEW